LRTLRAASTKSDRFCASLSKKIAYTLRGIIRRISLKKKAKSRTTLVNTQSKQAELVNNTSKMAMLPIDMMREFCTRFCKEEDIETAIEEIQKIMDSTLIHIGRHLSETDAPAEAKPEAKPAAKKAAKKSDSRCKCEGKNKKGEACRFYALEGKKYCKSHDGKSSDDENAAANTSDDSAVAKSDSDNEKPKAAPKKAAPKKSHIEKLKKVATAKVKTEGADTTDDGF